MGRFQRLADVAEITMGQSPPGYTCNTDGIGVPLLNGPTEFGPHHPHPVQYTTDPRKRAYPGDILFCVRGSTTGRMNWADREYAIGRGVAAIRHREHPELQPLVRAVIEHALPDLLAQATGSTFPNVSYDLLATIPWPSLPLSEQRAIAHILGTLDDKIERLRRMSETLEEMARAIFKAWFVDFLPVRAKMESRWKRVRSLPGLPAEGLGTLPSFYDLFPDRLVPSELGEIPEGWEVVSLADVIDINPPRSLQRGQIAPYLDMANMPTRGHVPETVKERRYTGSGTRFINGDTLLARITPSLENGKTAFVDFLEDGQVGWGSTEYIVLRPKPPFPEVFAYCLARNESFREFAIQSMTGTSGRQRVQPSALAHYWLVRPPAILAQRFGDVANSLFARAKIAMEEARTLAALRDALLPKLIRGEIRVKDAEKFLEHAGA